MHLSKPVGLTLAVAALALLAACGGADAPTSAGDSLSTSPKPQDPAYDTTWDVATPTLDAAAVEKWGQDMLDDAVTLIVGFAQDCSLNESLLNGSAIDNRDGLLAVQSLMTPASRADWNRYVERHVAEPQDESASQQVYSLCASQWFPTLNEWDGERGTAPTAGPTLVRPAITKLRAGVTDDVDRLQVTADITGDVRMTHNGQPAFWRFPRSTTFYLVEEEGRWAIDGWKSRFRGTPELTPEQ